MRNYFINSVNNLSGPQVSLNSLITSFTDLKVNKSDAGAFDHEAGFPH